MSSDVKTTTFSPAETESVGDKLGYGKDSKERLPWEHYLSQYQESDPKEIAARLGIFYDEEQKYFTLKFLGTVYQISWPDFQVTHEEVITDNNNTYQIVDNTQEVNVTVTDDSFSAEWCGSIKYREIQNLQRNAVG